MFGLQRQLLECLATGAGATESTRDVGYGLDRSSVPHCSSSWPGSLRVAEAALSRFSARAAELLRDGAAAARARRWRARLVEDPARSLLSSALLLRLAAEIAAVVLRRRAVHWRRFDSAGRRCSWPRAR